MSDETPGSDPITLDELAARAAARLGASEWSTGPAAGGTLLPWSRIYGSTLPRIYTPPLVVGPEGPCGCGCALDSTTSYGFDVVEFARDVLGQPLDPWQRWLVIHAGELLGDGRPRFRTVLVLVARQNGKTHLLKVLTLFWMYVEKWPMTVGISSNLDYAREAWDKACQLAVSVPALVAKNGGKRKPYSTNNNNIRLVNGYGSTYRIAAANRRGGRSLTIDRLVVDEVREQDSFDTVNAAVPAMNARPYGQAWFISNQGDDKSVVLDSMRASAIEHLRNGGGDDRMMLAEWSAPDGSAIDDEQALAAANPNVGRRIDIDDLLAQARRVLANPLAKDKNGITVMDGFKIEVLCMRVRTLDAAVDAAAWADAFEEGTMGQVRRRVALVFDVAPDQQHATLVAAAVLPDGRVRVEPVAAWSGPQTGRQVRDELLSEVARVGPVAFGWLPNGPAAAYGTELRDRSKRAGGRPGAPRALPRRIRMEEITGEVATVCMGLSSLVSAGGVVHGDDPLLNAHITGSEKLYHGDVWVFSRRGEGHCDAAYAVAGAVHLARTLPTSVGKPRLIFPEQEAV